MHGLRQSAYVVMRFNGYGRSMYRNAFNHIRINSPLAAHLGIADGSSAFGKHVYKQLADNFSFLFGVGNPGKSVVEQLSGIYPFYVQPAFLIRIQYALEFVLSYQSVIHENPRKIICDSLMNKSSCYCRILPSTQGHDYLPVSNLVF